MTKRRFGRTTSEAVKEFQRRCDLPATGRVDPKTLVTIDQQLGNDDALAFSVVGRVKRKNDEPLQPVTIRAFDKDLRLEQLLGETRTNTRGRYEIKYSTEQFARAEKRSADLIVRAFDENGLVIAESPVLFNARWICRLGRGHAPALL